MSFEVACGKCGIIKHPQWCIRKCPLGVCHTQRGGGAGPLHLGDIEAMGAHGRGARVSLGRLEEEPVGALSCFATPEPGGCVLRGCHFCGMLMMILGGKSKRMKGEDWQIERCAVGIHAG